MGLINANIGSKEKRILSKSLEKIVIIVEDGQESVDAGYIDEGSIKLKFPADKITLINKSTIQVGYDFSFEIKALQFYSLYEYEKLINKTCTLNLYPLNVYIKNVRLNIGGEFSIGENKSPIVISGSKHVNKIRDVIDGNPYGSLAEPWETESVQITINPGIDTIGIENLL